MNGTAIQSAAVVANPGSAFEVMASADLNGDGKSDIILQDGAGQAVGWLMDGTAILDAGAIGPATARTGGSPRPATSTSTAKPTSCGRIRRARPWAS